MREPTDEEVAAFRAAWEARDAEQGHEFGHPVPGDRTRAGLRAVLALEETAARSRMTAQDVVAQWIAERDAAIEANEKGFEHSPGPSITAGSWNGSGTADADLRREASLLRLLQRALANDAEVEAAKAAAEVEAAKTAADSIVHAAPLNGEPLTPCCKLSPFELPMTDRMTMDTSLVTCRGRGTP